MRKGLSFVPVLISVVAMFFSLLSLKLKTIPVQAASQPKYVTEIVVPSYTTIDKAPEAIQQAIQSALDKKSADGWQLQTMTVQHDSNVNFPFYVLAFKK